LDLGLLVIIKWLFISWVIIKARMFNLICTFKWLLIIRSLTYGAIYLVVCSILTLKWAFISLIFLWKETFKLIKWMVSVGFNVLLENDFCLIFLRLDKLITIILLFYNLLSKNIWKRMFYLIVGLLLHC
jgi:hypothetical protein